MLLANDYRINEQKNLIERVLSPIGLRRKQALAPSCVQNETDASGMHQGQQTPDASVVFQI